MRGDPSLSQQYSANWLLSATLHCQIEFCLVLELTLSKSFRPDRPGQSVLSCSISSLMWQELSICWVAVKPPVTLNTRLHSLDVLRSVMPTAETSGETNDNENGTPPTKYPDGSTVLASIQYAIQCLYKGEKEDELSTELTLDELKAAFRYLDLKSQWKKIHLSRLFDDLGEGFITVSRFRVRYFEYNVAMYISTMFQCNAM